MTKNLISLSRLDSKGFGFQGKGGVLKVYKGSNVVLRGIKHGTLYILQGSTRTGSIAVKSKNRVILSITSDSSSSSIDKQVEQQFTHDEGEPQEECQPLQSESETEPSGSSLSVQSQQSLARERSKRSNFGKPPNRYGREEVNMVGYALLVAEKWIKENKVGSADNPADMFTKSVPKSKFQQCLDLLNIRNI